MYLDASLSMSGFVNPSKRTRFDEFIDEIGNAMPGCHLYKYGQAGDKQPKSVDDVARRERFSLGMHRGGFYNLTYNPDDYLIEFLSGEPKEVLSVLITDGVYSEPEGGTTFPVVDAIRKWLDGGRVLGILVLRSAFSGPFYSESVRRIVGNAAASDRPFYAFVFSPNERGYRELYDRLKSRFPAIRSIKFSEDSIVARLRLPEGDKHSYSIQKPPAVDYYWQMFDSGLLSQRGGARLAYALTYAGSADYATSELRTEISAEYYRWVKGQFVKAPDGPPRGFEVNPQRVDCTIADLDRGAVASRMGSATPVVYGNGGTTEPLTEFRVTFPGDSTSDFGFYFLKLDTSIGSLRKDIMELSTRDDSTPASAGRTYRFFELMSAITDVHLKGHLAERTSPGLFVTVSNH